MSAIVHLDDCPICARLQHAEEAAVVDQFMRGLVIGIAATLAAICLVVGLMYGMAR